jgi:GNAT superfamily N-acetyltransferase
MAPTFRRATGDDAGALLAIMVEGFEGYRSFAPQGWSPEIAEVDRVRARLAAPDTWALLAEDGDRVAGHVGFARPPYWGTGLATELMVRAVAAAREQGFAEMRLFTPTLQRRARRFYEREGWAAIREFGDDRLGLDVAEYRRGL